MVLKEKLDQGWIHCSMIIEMLGKPADYIEKVIGEIGNAIDKTKGVEVIKSTPHDAQETKNGFFSTFTEIEFIVKDFNILAALVFSYLPSNIEILAPQEVKISLNDFNEFMNWLAGRLHGYDNLAKKMKIENMLLKKRLEELGAIPKQPEQPSELDSVKTEEDKKELSEESKENKE